MVNVEIGSAGSYDSRPDNVYWGQKVLENAPGLTEQVKGGACLAEQLEEQVDMGRAGSILRNTVDIGVPTSTVPGTGVTTVRRCAREACPAECQLTIGAYAKLKEVTYSDATAPITNCQSRPIRRRAWRILKALGT